MSEDTLRSVAPPILRPLLPDFFDRPMIVESRATCDDCVMCPKPGQAPVPGVEFFDPAVRCCTYQPSLQNYVVGAIFEDPAPELEEGRKRLRAKIAARFGVTPHKIAPPRKYNVLHEAARGLTFGRSKVLLCPYYADGGTCTVWKHRNAVCATFFCKHERGAASRHMWIAISHWLLHVEKKVAAWAAKAVDEEVTDLDLIPTRMTLDDLEDRPPSAKMYASWWKSWVGREEEFYRACYARVRDGLDPAEVARLVDDDEGKKLFAEMQARLAAATRPALASRLVLNARLKMQQVAGGTAVVGYSPLDVQVLAEGLYEVISQLRADETVAEFLERMRKEHEVELAPELLLHLQLFDVLVPPGKPKEARPATLGEQQPAKETAAEPADTMSGAPATAPAEGATADETAIREEVVS